MTDAPEKIWAFYAPEIEEDNPQCTIVAGEHCMHGAQEYIRADAIAKHVKVKPLVWDGDYAPFDVAADFMCFYNITPLDFGLAQVEFGVMCSEFGDRVIWRGPADEAKAAADAHHEARIREDLE